jgi:rod shape-determining protein MreC
MQYVSFFKRHGRTIVFFILVFLSLFFIYSDDTTQSTDFRDSLRDQVYALNDAMLIFDRIERLQSENERLAERYIKLKQQLDANSELYLQNQRFRQFFQLSELGQFDYTFASVIGRDISYPGSGYVLNKGLRDTISINMVVVAPKGLVGRIVRVGETSSIVQMLNDKDLRVSCRIQRNRFAAILSYDLNNTFLLNYVPNSIDVRVGDVIVTSGLSPIYPKGIRIGTVKSVVNQSRELFKNIEIQPAVQFDRLDEVFIVKKSDEE